MLVYSYYKFKEANCIIPNIDRIPGITIVSREDQVDYYYSDNLLVRFKLNEAGWFCSSINREVAKETRLFHTTPNSHKTLIDTLFYTANPYDLKLNKKTPLGLTRVLQRLERRLRNYDVSYGSKITTKFVNEIINFLVPKPTDLEGNLEKIISYCGDAIRHDYKSYFYNYTRFDIATLQWRYVSNLKGFNTRLGILFTSDSPAITRLYGLSPSTNYRLNGMNMFYDPNTEVVYNNRVYLQSELNLTQCPECSTIVPSAEITEHGCPHCIEALGKIHSYSTKAPQLLKFKAKKVTPATLYLGAELEYESESNKHTDAIFANKVLKGHAILKSDGSINNGFEIVTCPATLEVHLEEFKRFFVEFKEKTKLVAESNTGMHVHISRKPLSTLTVGKMTAFLNADDNLNFIETIAGRRLNSYCKQDSSRTVSFPLVYGKGARYNPLNLNNEETVEIRIFSTPETFEEFAYKLEFSDALARYCSPCSSGLNVYEQLKHSNFISWVMNNKHSYPHLVTKLKTI